MGKMLIVMGIFLVIIGILMNTGLKIPWIGRLPGDISVQRENFSFYFPLTSCIIISIILTLLGLSGDLSSLAIVVHPTVFSAALGVASGSDPNKIEYLTKGTILGVPVILSSYALTTLTTGSYVAVAGYFKHYALAIAQEIQIDQIKTVGSDNITFQSFMYMQGKPLIGASFRRLKTG